MRSHFQIIALSLALTFVANAALAEVESTCLKGLRRQKLFYDDKLADLKTSEHTMKSAVGITAVGFLACVYKFRSIGGVAACAAGVGTVAAIPYSNQSEIAHEILKLNDSMILLRLYEETQAGVGEKSELVPVIVRDLKIPEDKVSEFLSAVVKMVDADKTCNTRNGRPLLVMTEVAEQTGLVSSRMLDAN